MVSVQCFSVNSSCPVGEAIFSQDAGANESSTVDNKQREVQNDQEVLGELKVTADLVVGADGARSKTRSKLQQMVRYVYCTGSNICNAMYS